MDAQMDWPKLLRGGHASKAWRRDVTTGQTLRRPLAQVQRSVESSSLPRLSNRLFGHFSVVGTQPFIDPADFSWTALLEEHYPAIREEAERVLKVRAALPNFQLLFLDVVRPLRPPVSWVNSMVLAAVQRSPFITAARAQHVKREAAFTAAWNQATDQSRTPLV